MSAASIAIGTRGSALALVQARLVAAALERTGRATRIVTIETQGDRTPPDVAWGEGVFVAAIERALLEGQVDVAVHSAKDMPTETDPRLTIGAYLPRADPRDALVVRVDATARSLDDLPPGARVGTDSPRRTGFLLARRPDLDVHPLHGNVDTRLRRLDEGETDALVIACAGLDRLGRGQRIACRIAAEIIPPAPGQGAIAVQARADDAATVGMTAAIDDRPTRLAVEAERSFLAASGGGCRAPIGALAAIEADELVVLGGRADPDGSSTAVERVRGNLVDGVALGRELAALLASTTPPSRSRAADAGAAEGATRPRVLVTRASGRSDELADAIVAAGLQPVTVPTIEIALGPAGGELDRAAERLATFDWVVVTSANGVRAIVEAAKRVGGQLAGPAWATVGRATAAELERAGIDTSFQPSRAAGRTLAAEVPIQTGARVLVVRGDLTDGRVATTLRERGAAVEDIVAYRTTEAPAGSAALLRDAIDVGPIAAIVFTSGSTARGLVALDPAGAFALRAIPAVCIGPATVDEARAAGFTHVTESPTADAAGLAGAVAEILGVTSARPRSPLIAGGALR